MLSFAYPYLLLLLLAVPLVALVYTWARYMRRRNLRKFGKPENLKDLMPEVSPYKPPVKLTVQLLALALIIVALARPWGGVKDEKTSKEGIEVMIAIDVSNSMLASSTPDPQGVSRMRTAKLVLEKLIGRLDNDRVGLIVYAADAYTLVPITTDYVSAKTFLNSIDPSQVTDQGTNISAAINMAAASFSPKSKTGKAIILITDAEELEDREAVMQTAKDVAKSGIQIDVVGVGSESPVQIPYRGSFLIDPETGEPARTMLNEDLATEIAQAGGGIYVNASNREALNELEKQLSSVKKSAWQSNLLAVHDELFRVFVWVALALLIIDILLLERKNSWLDRITFFKKDKR